MKPDLKSLPMPELRAKLDSSADGLSQAEAQKRLTQYGPNEIEEKKTNPFLRFLTYFWGPIPWMIEGAVILSGVVGHWPDFFIILLLLLSNAVVGFWEEHQAGNAIAARGRTSDDFPNAHARLVLVHTPRADSMGRGARHANGGDSDCGLWAVYDTPRAGLGCVRLGLCSGLVSGE
jgi:hypothetical protein